MNALFEEPNSNVVTDAADAVVLNTEFGNMKVHHESILLDNMQTALAQIGGRTHGPNSSLSDGSTLDIRQFEIQEKEEYV